MENKQLPPKIPQALVDYLDKAIPDRCPSIDTPDRKVWFDAGRRSVVVFLQTLLQHQNTSEGMPTVTQPNRN